MSSVNVAAGNLIVSLEDSGSRRGDFHTAVKGSRSRHIRKLQTARQSREFWAECEVQTLRSGPVSLRYLIGSEGETFATVCLKVVTLEGSQRLVRFHATACLADSHRKKSSLVETKYIGARFFLLHCIAVLECLRGSGPLSGRRGAYSRFASLLEFSVLLATKSLRESITRLHVASGESFLEPVHTLL
jgi:hypothetical protein